MSTPTPQWTQWNVTYDNTSPQFIYSPSVADALTGWASVFVDDGSNTSYHYTSLSGAGFSLQYYGLNLTLYGSSNASYSATFDGQNFEPNPIADEGVLLAFASNNHELHNMNFTVDVQDPTEQVLVDKAIITTAAKGVLTSPNDTAFDVYSGYFGFQGSWKDKSTVFPLPSDQSIAVRATSNPGDTASFTFSGRAVAVYGPINSTSGRYSVRINGGNLVYNASSPVPVPEALLAYSDGHNEDLSYTISLTNLDSTTLSISRIDIFQVNTTDENPVAPVSTDNGAAPSSTVSTGTESAGASPARITGIIIGAVMGGLVLLSMCGLIWRKWSRPRWADRYISEDYDEDKLPSPYTIRPPSHSRFSEVQPPRKAGLTPSHPNSHQMAGDPGRGEIASAQSTVERLLYLIANQIDSDRERLSDLDRHYDQPLPPYPETAYSRSS